MKERAMNRKRETECIKKTKLEDIRLSAKDGKSLASVIVFIKADNLDKRTGK
jgi:hypothetical protein